MGQQKCFHHRPWPQDTRDSWAIVKFDCWGVQLRMSTSPLHEPFLAFGESPFVLGDLQKTVGFSNGSDAAAALEAGAFSNDALDCKEEPKTYAQSIWPGSSLTACFRHSTISTESWICNYAPTCLFSVYEELP